MGLVLLLSLYLEGVRGLALLETSRPFCSFVVKMIPKLLAEAPKGDGTVSRGGSSFIGLD